MVTSWCHGRLIWKSGCREAKGVTDFRNATIYTTLEPCHRGPGKYHPEWFDASSDVKCRIMAHGASWRRGGHHPVMSWWWPKRSSVVSEPQGFHGIPDASGVCCMCCMCCVADTKARIQLIDSFIFCQKLSVEYVSLCQRPRCWWTFQREFWDTHESHVPWSRRG